MPPAPAGKSSQVVMLMRVRSLALLASARGGAGQAGDIQWQPGFKGFSELVSGGGESLQLGISLSWHRGFLSPLGFPEHWTQGRVNGEPPLWLPDFGSSCAPQLTEGGKPGAAAVHCPAPAPGAAAFLTLHPVVASASSFQTVVARVPGFWSELGPPTPLLHSTPGNPFAVLPKEVGSPPSLEGSTHLDHSLWRNCFIVTPIPPTRQ